MFNQLLPQSWQSKTLPGLAAIASLGFAISVQLPVSAQTLTPVNVELSLLVDDSGSIDNREYALQMGGYRDAFIALSSQFGSGAFGTVAVNLIQWAGANQQRQAIPWTLINDQASAIRFANALGALPSFYGGSTAPGSAIQFAVPLFSSNAYEGQRWVIDVSGDGAENAGVSTRTARDNALAAGVSAINGLPIVTIPSAGVEAWYRNNIQGGAGSFVIAANGFEDFDRAIEQKLIRELTPPAKDDQSAAVPEPATMLGIALAGSGLAYFKRRRTV